MKEFLKKIPTVRVIVVTIIALLLPPFALYLIAFPSAGLLMPLLLTIAFALETPGEVLMINLLLDPSRAGGPVMLWALFGLNWIGVWYGVKFLAFCWRHIRRLTTNFIHWCLYKY